MDWKEYSLGELLDYEQPAKYIVNSTEYNNAYKTPVLTAGKSFIIGYTNEKDGVFEELPVIIFDDFTTATQYVNFRFKVKSSAMKILKPKKELVNPKFIYYRMQNIQLDHSTHKRYWLQHYSKLRVAIPDLIEQQRIVSRIEELFSELDAGIEELKKIKNKLGIYRQAILKEAFKKNNQWETFEFQELLEDMRNGYGKKPTDNGDYKILKISAVRSMNLDLHECRQNSSEFNDKEIIKENDLLFTRYNGSSELVGVCAAVPELKDTYAYPDKIIRCRLKFNNSNHARFLQYYINQGEARMYIRSKIKTTSGQNGIAGSDIKKLCIYLPSLEIQERIVSYLDEKMSNCDKITTVIENAIYKADMMRQSILKQAFEGRL
ncbi:MAG TPA: hypothetical protein DEO87_08335 [Lachnospiraceae bacterium]|nr:hypothetical protein [Lachnospiraceae bacterium]